MFATNNHNFLDRVASYSWLASVLFHALPIMALALVASKHVEIANSGIEQGIEVEIASFAEFNANAASEKIEKSNDIALEGNVAVKQKVALENTESQKASNLLASRAGQEDYSYRLLSRIEKYKKYPKSAKRLGIQGNVVVTFVLDKNGKLKKQQLVNGSGYKVLDNAAQSIIAKASPFPPLPAEYEGETSFTLPVTFEIHS
jgi:TonB family protein